MYFRSSPRGTRAHKRGPQQHGSSHRPFKHNGNGFYAQSRPNRGVGRVSQLQGKVDIFIKKATNVVTNNVSYEQKSFTDFNLNSPHLLTNIQNKGYSEPTPIQVQAIEPILAGRDLIGIANTGTGKTAAFLIPIVNQIFINRNKKALIVTPTRELAQQITDEFRSFTQNMPIYSSLVIGGANIKRQMQDLRRNPHVVVATPGRLKDLVQRHTINLTDFSIFVLDEVDLMVDIGFINDVRYFIGLLPKERQSLFFSATISPKVHEVLNAFVKDPVTVSVKVQDTAENVDQDVVRVIDRNRKVDQLHQLLIQQEFDKVLIFGRTKHGIDKLNKELQLRGFKVGAIHGNKNQGQRQRILDSFKRHEIQILLATDVASRGLDIPNVSHVINYDLPQTFDDYIHRIGRTGRADKKGVALTFVE